MIGNIKRVHRTSLTNLTFRFAWFLICRLTARRRRILPRVESQSDYVLQDIGLLPRQDLGSFDTRWQREIETALGEAQRADLHIVDEFKEKAPRQ